LGILTGTMNITRTTKITTTSTIIAHFRDNIAIVMIMITVNMKKDIFMDMSMGMIMKMDISMIISMGRKKDMLTIMIMIAIINHC
jgi:ABC-type uncharacterized transport system permease subunit